MRKFLSALISLVFILAACSPLKKSTSQLNDISVSGIRLIGEYILPNDIVFKNSTVGGLSSIDYDPKNDIYYMICDDPSAHGPARFYTAKILFSEKGIDSVQLSDMVPLLDASGKTFPDITKDRFHSLDAESMRYNPLQHELVYGSEGQRVKNSAGVAEVQNPVIIAANLNGSFKDSFALPQNVYLRNTENGPRHNSVFEGLAFANNYRFMYVSIEEPLYEDGPRAGNGDSTASIRILKFDTKTRKQVAQYAYQIDAVPYEPVPPGAFKINGVPDILSLGNDKFIVTERAYITGRKLSYARFYLADAKGATDIADVKSLIENPPTKTFTKKLLFNMESIGRHVDNVEGLTIGPKLPNGHYTLIAVADNNFSDKQQTQFWLFEIIP